jgi:hypothetical protein
MQSGPENPAVDELVPPADHPWQNCQCRGTCIWSKYGHDHPAPEINDAHRWEACRQPETCLQSSSGHGTYSEIPPGLVAAIVTQLVGSLEECNRAHHATLQNNIQNVRLLKLVTNELLKSGGKMPIKGK